MIEGGIGGANTQTGAKFELEFDLPTFFNTLNGYCALPNDKAGVTCGRWKVYFCPECSKGANCTCTKGSCNNKNCSHNEKQVAEIFQKGGLYRYFDEINYDYEGILSKKLLPDDSIFVFRNNTVFIIEKKTQKVAGSVDEKLQTCGFKLQQYKKLFAPLNKEVSYNYILNKDWFLKPEYKDVLDYIIEQGCQYYFDYMPLSKLGLPVADI